MLRELALRFQIPTCSARVPKSPNMLAKLPKSQHAQQGFLNPNVFTELALLSIKSTYDQSLIK